MIGPDWSSSEAWDNVLRRLRDRARAIGAREIRLCEGNATIDATGPLSGRSAGIWRTIYMEDNGLIIEDLRTFNS